MLPMGIMADSYKPVSGSKILNWVSIAAPRNGTTVHNNVSAASGTVKAGTLFTPTAGRFLILIVTGPVTSTTDPDWTFRDSEINNMGLYAFTRTASGTSTDEFSTSHGAANNYPINCIFIECSSSASWGSSVSGLITAGAANPNLTGLTGSNNLVLGVVTQSNLLAPGAISAVWNAPNTELLDVNEPPVPADAYFISICKQENYASSSYQPTATLTNPAALQCEAMTIAITAP